MPLVSNSALPSYTRLKTEGQTILAPDRALTQEIRELHIGILNMMPDRALEAIERQFLRLIGNSSLIAQFHVHFFSLDTIERTADIKEHIDTYYEPFEQIKENGLDGLIITGANVSQPDLSKEPFWDDLCAVLDWADQNVTSTICSCLATHAAVEHLYGIKRTPMDKKLSGLYEHYKSDREHPLLQAVNTEFAVPHSRHNEITKQQLLDAGCHIMVESDIAGVHMATSPDRFRFLFFQGHPEYDTYSLLKEYKRDIHAFVYGDRESWPDLPENYFRDQSVAILEEFKTRCLRALEKGEEMPEFPEELILERLFNIWRDTSKSIMNNWIGNTYQITDVERTKPYMEGIDRDDPLGIKTKTDI